MSFLVIKNLRVNKKTGVISGDVADSSITNKQGNYIYHHIEDIYQDKEKTRTPLEKYAQFIYDVIIGRIKVSSKKYDKLKHKINNYYDDCSFYATNNNGNPYVLTYLKYKRGIDNFLKGNEEDIKDIDNQSEYEKYYELEVISKYDFKTIRNEIYFINKIFSVLWKKGIEMEEIQNLFDARIKNISKDKEIIRLYKSNDNNICISIFPKLKIEKNYCGVNCIYRFYDKVTNFEKFYSNEYDTVYGIIDSETMLKERIYSFQSNFEKELNDYIKSIEENNNEEECLP